MANLIWEVAYCSIPYPPECKVIDIGSGAGVLGCVMAKLNPHIELEMTDISALAIRSSQET